MVKVKEEREPPSLQSMMAVRRKQERQEMVQRIEEVSSADRQNYLNVLEWIARDIRAKYKFSPGTMRKFIGELLSVTV